MNIRACSIALALTFVSAGNICAQKAWWQWVNVEDDDTVPAMDVSGVFVKDSEEIFFYGKMQGAGQHAITAYGPDGKIKRHILKTQGDVNPVVRANQWGQVIVSGYFRGQAVIDTLSYNAPGPGNAESFIAILDSTGTLKNIRVFGINSSFSSDVTSDMAVYSDAIYLTGASSEKDSGPGDQDFYVARYDTSAQRVWAAFAITPGYSSGLRVVTDDNGNVYVAGGFADSILFLPDSLNMISNGSRDIFIVKYDSLGQLLWARNYSSTSYDAIRDMQWSKNKGLILLASFGDSINIDGHSFVPAGTNKDAAFLYMNMDGEVSYIKESTPIPYDFAIDSNDIIYVTGALADSICNDTVVSSYGESDLYVAVFNKNGDFSYVVNFGTEYGEGVSGLACDDNMNVYLAGDVNSSSGPATAHFGPFTSPVSTWNIDFIAKLTFDQTLHVQSGPAFRPSAVRIFPNPAASSSVNIVFDASVSPHGSTLAIHNSLGKLVAEYPLPGSAASHTLQLPRLGSGVYIVRLSTPEGVATGKLIVQ